jgi:hypothetical protein
MPFANIEDFTQHAADLGLLTADGFDDAIIGISQRKGSEPCVAYDYDKCVDILMERDGMDYTEACEFMDFNVTDAYIGDHTPSFITRIEREAE